jgi:hypothetical protein
VSRAPVVEFSTTAYEFAHGRKPRGRGSWAFGLRGADLRGGAELGELVWFSGTYSEAKRAARAHFAASHPHAEFIDVTVAT